MQINRHKLDNGLRLVHIHDAASQMVYVNILYGVGARNEQPEYTGIAHLFDLRGEVLLVAFNVAGNVDFLGRLRHGDRGAAIVRQR